VELQRQRRQWRQRGDWSAAARTIVGDRSGCHAGRIGTRKYRRAPRFARQFPVYEKCAGDILRRLGVAQDLLPTVADQDVPRRKVARGWCIRDVHSRDEAGPLNYWREDGLVRKYPMDNR